VREGKQGIKRVRDLIIGSRVLRIMACHPLMIVFDIFVFGFLRDPLRPSR
jgi:hypothetical protein